MSKTGTESEHRSDECLIPDVLIALVTGVLSDDEKTRTQAHLAWCSLCREEVEEMRQFLGRDLAEELSQSPPGANPTAHGEVPKQLLDRLFPQQPTQEAESVGEKKSEEHHREIDNLLQTAERAFYVSRLAEAKIKTEEALALAQTVGSRKDEGRALGRLGSIYLESGDTAQALHSYEQSLHIARASGYRQGEGFALGGLGTIASAQGDYRKAIAYIEQAIAVAQETDSRRLVCRRLNNLAVPYLGLGDSTKALACYTQALAIAREVGDRLCEARVIGGLATCYKMLGDFSRARASYEQGLHLAREVGDRQGEGRWLNNLGTVYLRLGDLSQAATCYEQALAIATDIGDQDGEATRARNLGALLAQQGNYPLARSYLERSVVIARQRGKHQEGEARKSLGNLYLRQGDFPQAMACYEPALRIAQETGNKRLEGDLLGNLAIVSAGLGKFEQAVAYLRRGIETLHVIGMIDDERQLWAALGAVYLRLGNVGGAHEAFLTSLRYLDDIRGSIPLMEEQSGVLERGLSAYQGMVETCLTFHRPAAALEYVEWAKSDRLVQLLLTHDLRPKSQVPPGLVHEYEESRQKLRSLAYALRMGQGARPDHPLTQQTQAEFAEARKHSDQVVANIKQFDPDFVAAVQSEPITYASIQETIPDEHTALIEFFLTEEEVLAFVVLKYGDPLPPVILPGLAPSHLQDLAHSWLHTYATFRSNPAAEWTRWRDTMDATLTTLHDRLFLPLQPLLAAHTIRKLVFIPSQALHLFPLHALSTEEHGQRRYLIDLYEEISYAPSVAVLQRCQQRRRPSPQEVFLVCNPDRAGQYGRPLQHAEQEAQRIRAHYPETRGREQEQASPDTVLQEVRNAHVLHLICHGFFDVDQPLQSYLGLFSQRLTLGEIFAKLELPEASLVVLSACETGVVKMSRIDEYVGLPSGFLSAGAPTVISSLWMVDDEATSRLMEKFYDNFQAGVSKGRALNDAQRWLRTAVQEKPDRIAGQGQPRFSLLAQPFPVDYSHPFYWAAFCLSGAPR